MDNIFSGFPEPQTEAESQAIIAQLFAEMRRLNERMREDQAEIDRLKSETQFLKAETRATLDRLKAMV